MKPRILWINEDGRTQLAFGVLAMDRIPHDHSFAVPLVTACYVGETDPMAEMRGEAG